MDRTLPSRLTALLAAVLFLFSWTGDALGWHACPHHSSVPGPHARAVVEDAADHGAHGGHQAAAPDAASDAEHGGDSHDSEPGGAHGCTCTGTCPSAIGGAVPTVTDAGLRVAPASIRDARPDDSADVLPRLVPFFLPYGQAPPLLG